MSSTTQCPTCDTCFKVTQEQLEAHKGLVRCGRCHGVFNAAEHMLDEQPSPQLDLLTEIPPEQPAEPAQPDTAAEPANGEDEPTLAEEARYEWHDPDQPSEPAPAPLAKVIKIEELHEAQPGLPAEAPRLWPWIAGSVFLIFVLLAQALYFYRIEIAANHPGAKPALVAYCRILGCSVPLPQKADQMSIESSFLEADAVQPGVIVLNALLRNHAGYAQAYPQLELTLTDAQDKALARRTFRPADYLKPEVIEQEGLGPNRELPIKLNLDTADLKPSGYRLLLFYPQ